MGSARAHLVLAFHQIPPVHIGGALVLLVGHGKINDGAALIKVKNTAVQHRKARVVILVRVGNDDVFQLAVGHVLVEIFRDIGDTGGAGACVDENIGIARFDIRAIPGVFVAQLREVDLQLPVDQHRRRFVAFELRGRVVSRAEKTDPTAERKAEDCQKHGQPCGKFTFSLRHSVRPPHCR